MLGSVLKDYRRNAFRGVRLRQQFGKAAGSSGNHLQASSQRCLHLFS
jgi:hypothetical protein